MPLSEFEIIERCFSACGVPRGDVSCGIGDDAALIEVPSGMELAVAIDTLVEDIHFPAATPAHAIGYKALAVNLSDLAAMGAEPAWFTLALTLPTADEGWLRQFSAGMGELATRHGMQLVGGDTTRGALIASVQVAGYVPRGAALRRAGARPGDYIYVTGTVGDAALGLAVLQGRAEASAAQRDVLAGRLHYPVPRIAEGQALRELATACIDVSDGLAADLQHLLSASGVGAQLHVARLPLSAELCAVLEAPDARYRLALAGGDDYELCFTAPPAQEVAVTQALAACGCAVTRIGVVCESPGLQLVDAQGKPVSLDLAGYEHFAGNGR